LNQASNTHQASEATPTGINSHASSGHAEPPLEIDIETHEKSDIPDTTQASAHSTATGTKVSAGARIATSMTDPSPLGRMRPWIQRASAVATVAT
jgi:hypothetical protein